MYWLRQDLDRRMGQTRQTGAIHNIPLAKIWLRGKSNIKTHSGQWHLVKIFTQGRVFCGQNAYSLWATFYGQNPHPVAKEASQNSHLVLTPCH